MIQKQTEITHINLDQPFTLQTGASDVAISGILYQGKKIVRIYNNKIRGTERNYTSMEKESLTAYKSLEQSRPPILGRNLHVLTDKKKMTYQTNSNKRLQRWKIALCDFDLSFSHVEGKNDGRTDYLSRLEPCLATTCQDTRDEIHKLYGYLLHPGGCKLYQTMRQPNSTPGLQKMCRETPSHAENVKLRRSTDENDTRVEDHYIRIAL